MKSYFFETGIFVSLLLSSCAPVTPNTDATVEMGLDLKRLRSSSLNANGNSYQLPTDHCYSIHVHGANPLFNRITEDFAGTPGAMCPVQPSRIGRFFGFYDKGQAAQINVVAETLTFDLVAMSKNDLGIDASAACPAGFSVEPFPDPAKNNQLRPRPMLNGVELQNFDPQSVVVLASATTQIAPGLNTVTLTGVVDSVGLSSLNSSWASLNGLGMPYFCDDGGGSGDALYLVGPSQAGPVSEYDVNNPNEFPPKVFTGMTSPFAKFSCPTGAATVHLQREAAGASAASTYSPIPCVGGGSNSGGVAFFSTLNMPAEFWNAGPPVNFSFRAQAKDSANQNVGVEVRFQLHWGSRYFALRSNSRSGGTSEEPAGAYGALPTGTTVRFAGKRNVPGERYLFLNRIDTSGSSSNGHLTAIKLKDTTSSSYHPFDWDGSVSDTTTHPHTRSLYNVEIARYSESANRLRVGTYTSGSRAVEETPALNFSSYSALGSSLAATLTTVTSSANFSFMKGFAELGNVFLTLGTQGGTPSYLFRPVFRQGNADTYINNFHNGSSNLTDLSYGTDRFFGFLDPDNTQAYFGFIESSVAPSRLAVMRCGSTSTCTTDYQIFQVSGASGSSGGDPRTAAIVKSKGGTVVMLTARSASVQRNILSGFANTQSITNLPFTTESLYSGTAFNPPVVSPSSFYPNFVLTVEKPFQTWSEEWDFDLLLGGYVTESSIQRAVLYRSPDGGLNWYLVHKEMTAGTNFVDAEVVDIQYHEFNNGQQTGNIGTYKGAAVILENFTSSSYKVFWQDHLGY
jgi:hypothetical protein